MNNQIYMYGTMTQMNGIVSRAVTEPIGGLNTGQSSWARSPRFALGNDAYYEHKPPSPKYS